MTEYEAFVRAEAERRGIDPDVAVIVANSEGGLTEPARRGTFPTGSSWYAFQLHYGGKGYEHFGTTAGMGNSFSALTGWQPGDPKAWRDAARYALDRAKAGGWSPWYGAAARGITGFYGINPARQWAGTPASEWDYLRTGGPAPSLPPAPATPTTPAPVAFDATYPTISQNDDWSCAPTALRWALHAFGRRPTEGWIEPAMIAAGVVSEAAGLTDASGRGLAAFVVREYGEYGYGAYHADPVLFDDVRSVAGRSPVLLGGRRWGPAGHWSGVRGYDAVRDVLLLANPAENYGGQTMSRQDFERVGPCSMVVLTHAGSPATPQPAPAAYYRDGDVGSGLLAAMREDGTVPAAPSTFLPLGRNPAVIEECVALDGTLYRWHLPTGTTWRYRPS